MNKELLIQCQLKDRNAQRKVYELMAGKLFAVCKRYLKNQEDCEEVLADTFYKIFTKLDQLQDENVFEAWAKKIAVNECLQKLRSSKALPLSVDNDEVLESSDVETDHISLEKDILKLLNYLPEGCRAIFNLFAIEGYPHKEIASMLSISEGTSKSQLNFARKRLQQLLANHTI
ncbi:RNA polymerase sigma factor [Chryseobacterium sp.]|uniref:RNA polymerase sigma factor n=1 Tax=Chryseobacterium sp. TaxID=1871047 RepID=UPI003890EC82